MAVAGMTLGIIGVLLGIIPILAGPTLICGVLTLVFGSVGLSVVMRNPLRSGKRMAIAGIVLGLVAVGSSIVGFAIVYSAFS